MIRSEVLERILRSVIVTIIRMKSSGPIMKVLEALKSSGVETWEITLNTPDALTHIEKIAREDSLALIGAGTVQNAEMARRAINAGARFLVTPTVDHEIVETAHQYEVPVFMGAFSPTEVLAAHSYGADMVKLFPAGVNGIQYFKALRGPLENIRIMPTGGITTDNVGEWIMAGAPALGVGSALTPPALINAGDFPGISVLAKKMLDNIAMARLTLLNKNNL